MIFQLDRCTDFPDPRYGNEDGFYAVDGEVTPERLAAAYLARLLFHARKCSGKSCCCVVCYSNDAE